MLVFLFLAPLLACDRALDVEPYQSIDYQNAIQNKTGIERAVTGVFDALQSGRLYGRDAIVAGDLAADNLVWAGTSLDYGQVASHQLPANNAIVEGIWAGAYDGINRVNNVLDRLAGIVDMTAEEKTLAEGRCRFIRGLLYFDLVRWYGAVPLRLVPASGLSGISLARSEPLEVLQVVYADLKFAADNLPSTEISGYPGGLAATGLLARMHLFRHSLSHDLQDVQEAFDKASAVLNSTKSLAVDFNTLFLPGENSESLFEVSFSAQDRNLLAQYFFTRNLTGRYEFAPTPSLLSRFEQTDARLSATIATDPENLPYCFKYRDVTAGSDRVYILRLAEMYTIRAEASHLLQKPENLILTDLNQLRLRAGLDSLTETPEMDISGLILQECQREFAFEGHRWHDLIRSGKAIATLGINPNQILFPIPLSELQTNLAMEPNPSN